MPEAMEETAVLPLGLPTVEAAVMVSEVKAARVGTRRVAIPDP